MRRDVSQQQATENADDALRNLVRLLARAAAREAVAATPRLGPEDHSACPEEGGDHAE